MTAMAVVVKPSSATYSKQRALQRAKIIQHGKTTMLN